MWMRLIRGCGLYEGIYGTYSYVYTCIDNEYFPQYNIDFFPFIVRTGADCTICVGVHGDRPATLPGRHQPLQLRHQKAVW